MILQEELAVMQANYSKKPMRGVFLHRPAWLRSDDPMSAVYREKDTLLRQGKVCYACIVQANVFLFQQIPHVDCPADVVFMKDPDSGNDPLILRDVAHMLFRFKNKPLEHVPAEWREIARVITDEYDRSDFTFSVEYEGELIDFRFIPTMIFRKLLPQRKLCGSLLPVLTAPGCDSIMILPKRYWSARFKQLWIDGEI